MERRSLYAVKLARQEREEDERGGRLIKPQQFEEDDKEDETEPMDVDVDDAMVVDANVERESGRGRWAIDASPAARAEFARVWAGERASRAEDVRGGRRRWFVGEVPPRGAFSFFAPLWRQLTCVCGIAERTHKHAHSKPDRLLLQQAETIGTSLHPAPLHLSRTHATPALSL